METINVSEIKAINESTAVAIGKVVAASELPVRIGEGVWDLTEEQFGELSQYLARRGVKLTGNDGDDMIAKAV